MRSPTSSRCHNNCSQPLTWGDKTHFHVKCLKNVLSFWVVLIGTVVALVGAGDLDESGLLGALSGTSTPVSSIS